MKLACAVNRHSSSTSSFTPWMGMCVVLHDRSTEGRDIPHRTGERIKTGVAKGRDEIGGHTIFFE
eukprot:5221140-Prymnesium_polylepis.1